MFGIIKDVHVNACFSKDDSGTQFCHTRHGAYNLDKLIIRFYADIEFNFGLGDHIVKIF